VPSYVVCNICTYDAGQQKSSNRTRKDNKGRCMWRLRLRIKKHRHKFKKKIIEVNREKRWTERKAEKRDN